EPNEPFEPNKPNEPNEPNETNKPYEPTVEAPKEVDQELGFKGSSEKVLPKTGDGLNPSTYGIMALVVGLALSFLGLRLRKYEK
ncbi:MAG: LPXTG cell wall anchor domain-containing protein, partial [Peptoniphilus sp.]|nr:LPXTG cell wall anchor domain-containing protein [Peptoniphilus sp.]